MGGAWETTQKKAAKRKQEQQKQAADLEAKLDLAHLKQMAEMSGVPLEQLLPKKAEVKPS